jgi:hypothetical protein
MVWVPWEKEQCLVWRSWVHCAFCSLDLSFPTHTVGRQVGLGGTWL